MSKPKDSPGSSADQPAGVIQIVLAIPGATIHQRTSNASPKKLVGQGELRVYSTSPEMAPMTTFMTLETNDTPTKSFKSLITHPLMPQSTAQKVNDGAWQFSVPGNGFLELSLSDASPEDVGALENLLADRVIYTNQYQLRNQLALVDDVGQIYGVLDKDDADLEDDDNVSLSENAKSPVVVEEIEPKAGEDKPRFRISVPSADDMADYLTCASQYFGENLVKGATVVAGGIASSSTYLNSKIPETQKPLRISPFIKNRIRNITKVSRATIGLSGRIKTALVSTVFSSGYKLVRYWTKKNDTESYSTMQHFAMAILNSAGVIIQAAEESFSIVTGPAIAATQELAGRTLGPDAKEMVAEALEGLKNFTLVYFDGAGVSRRAFLQSSRMAALQTAQEVREGKIKMREKKKEEKSSPSPSPSPSPSASPKTENESSSSATETKTSKTRQVKELIFSYFGKTGDGEGSSGTATDPSAKDSPSTASPSSK